MRKFSYVLIVICMLTCSVTFATADVSIGIGLPNLSIGINMPMYPHLERVPGYPVYYAPQVDANYFFYDGMYWVYQDDNWYASSWYNGPWSFVEPGFVPLFILRVPVHYYRQPPMYFHGWQSNAPPRWGQHWGPSWEQHRRGWDQWRRNSAPAPAPLPVYQRKFTGARYPGVEQQNTLRNRQYRYQPRDKVIRQHFQQQARPKAAAPAQRRQAPAAVHQRPAPAPAPAQQRKHEAPQVKSPKPQPAQRSMPQQHVAPAQRVQPAAPQQKKLQVAPQQRQQPAVQQQNRPQAAPQQRQQPAPQQKRKQEPGLQGQGQNKDEERGQGRNR